MMTIEKCAGNSVTVIKLDLENKEMALGLEISMTDLLFRSKKERIRETEEGINTLIKTEGICSVSDSIDIYFDFSNSLSLFEVLKFNGKTGKDSGWYQGYEKTA